MHRHLHFNSVWISASGLFGCHGDFLIINNFFATSFPFAVCCTRKGTDLFLLRSSNILLLQIFIFNFLVENYVCTCLLSITGLKRCEIRFNLTLFRDDSLLFLQVSHVLAAQPIFDLILKEEAEGMV